MIKRNWWYYGAVYGFAILSGAGLLHVSQNVQQAERELRRVQSLIEEEREAIRVLHAEWEYLNRPDRLEILAIRYLQMVPPSAQGIVTSAIDLPAVPEQEGVPVMAEGDDIAVQEGMTQAQEISAPASDALHVPPAPRIKPKLVPPARLPASQLADSQNAFHDLLGRIEEEQ